MKAEINPWLRYGWEFGKQAGRAVHAAIVAALSIFFMRLFESELGATPEQARFAVAIGFMSFYAKGISRVILRIAKSFAEDVDAQRLNAIEDSMPDRPYNPHRDI